MFQFAKSLRSCNIKSYSTTTSQISKLANGIRIATESAPGHFSALGVYVDAGSRYETSAEKGLSHIVDRLAFKSTQSFTGTEMLQKLELLGGNYMCASAREALMYQSSVFNGDVEKMLDLLAQTIRYPTITEEEVEEQKYTVDYEISEIALKHELNLPELLHTTAFQGETLGSPLLCPKERLPYITRDSILDYRNKFFKPENLVLAFVGVDHLEAIKLSEKYFGDMASSGVSTPNTGVAKYIGGEMTIPSIPLPEHMPEFSHFYLGFEGLGVNDEDIYALATLQTLLGGGGAFSAGGPGKGMYSRLYRQILNQYGYFEHCQAFNHTYTDSGIFGVQVSCMPQAAHLVPELIIDQLAQCFTNGRRGLTEIQVSRAKNQLKSSLLMNLESKMVELEDLGRQVQVHGKKIPVGEMVSKIENLSVKDVKRVAERVLTGNSSKVGTGRPTVIIQGERNTFGDIDGVLKRYGLGK